jgi:Homeodomain-like domain
MRPQHEIDSALALFREELTTSEISRRTGIPRSTVRDWRTGRGRRLSRECVGHDFSSLDAPAYGYLLGMYLGDGCVSRHRRGVGRLRITLDSIYTGIVAECVSAIEAVAAVDRPCRVAVGNRHGPRRAVPSWADPQRRHPDRRDGAEGSIRSSCAMTPGTHGEINAARTDRAGTGRCRAASCRPRQGPPGSPRPRSRT